MENIPAADNSVSTEKEYPMKHLYIFILLLGSAQQLKAQDDPDTAKLKSLIGTWDVYRVDGKETIGEFSAFPFGKSPAIQTRFIIPAMQTEVNGVWVYDAEIKTFSVFEISNTGLVRNYSGTFKKPEELWLDGYSKHDPKELTEQSSLTWFSEEKIQVWSKDMKNNMEMRMIMIRKK
jgi:hypothetical protein